MEWADYIVPTLGAITLLLAGIEAYRRTVEAGKDSVSRRWKELANKLEARVEDLEFDREANEAEIDAQRVQIRALEDRERKNNERLLSLERDHTALIAEHKTLRSDHAKLQASFKDLRAGVVLLIKQLIEAGLEPVWRPPENGGESRKES